MPFKLVLSEQFHTISTYAIAINSKCVLFLTITASFMATQYETYRHHLEGHHKHIIYNNILLYCERAVLSTIIYYTMGSHTRKHYLALLPATTTR